MSSAFKRDFFNECKEQLVNRFIEIVNEVPDPFTGSQNLSDFYSYVYKKIGEAFIALFYSSNAYRASMLSDAAVVETDVSLSVHLRGTQTYDVFGSHFGGSQNVVRKCNLKVIMKDDSRGVSETIEVSEQLN